MLSWLVKKALFVVRIAWIQALLPYGAAPFIDSRDSFQELTSNCDNVATSSPNSDKELKNYSSELKRKIFEESDYSPSKKLKQPVDELDLNHKNSNPLTFKPNIGSQAQDLIQKMRSSVKPTVDKRKKQMRPLVAYPWIIYQYAFLSSLRFPCACSGWKNHGFYGQVLTMSDLWQSLHGEGPRLPLLIESFTRLRHDAKTRTTIISRASSLLEEIFLRDSQFLVALTSPKSSNRPYKRQFQFPSIDLNMLRLEEQKNLLQWLVKLFNTNIECQDPSISHKSRVLNEETYSISSLNEMISDYLQEDLEKQEGIYGHWIEQIKRQGKLFERKASYTSAMRTKVAINTLGNYYKSTNPTKWGILFRCDWHFANVFALIKKYEHNREFTRLYKRYFKQLESLKLFPWKLSETPLNDKTQDIDFFSRSLENFNWNHIQKYFKYIDHNKKDEEMRLNVQVQKLGT
ncbi:hypothetical protein VP01_449g2 [Puccinia sorghi]|uniref:Uncharacterized protein n=1 Tax=Puccinia sorghi TaxID=27349 RepID=A0A0L6UP56_9BASI|nr:hypothetical protein VP01_449g2 [Puccinia sorghi]